MNKRVMCILCPALVLVIGIFSFTPGRPTSHLKDEALILNELTDRVAGLTAENSRLSNQIVQLGQASAKPIEPSAELLRLRGEVGRLRQDTEQIEDLRKEIIKLRQENQSVRGLSLNEMYYFNGLDTNQLPAIEIGATKDAVLAELRRVGALVVEEKERHISVRLLPVMSNQTSTNPMPIAMDFYFHEGKLVTRRDDFVGP